MINFSSDRGGFILIASRGGMLVILWMLATTLLLLYFLGLSIGRGSSGGRERDRDRPPG